jgi:hypothetical protein
MHATTPDPAAPRDWRPFALLLIDAQRDFWPDDSAARFPAFPDAVERLLGFCRAEGLEVVHLRARFGQEAVAGLLLHLADERVEDRLARLQPAAGELQEARPAAGLAAHLQQDLAAARALALDDSPRVDVHRRHAPLPGRTRRRAPSYGRPASSRVTLRARRRWRGQ